MLLKEWVAGGFYNMWMAYAFKRMGGQCFQKNGWPYSANCRLRGPAGAPGPGLASPPTIARVRPPILLKTLATHSSKSIGRPHIMKATSHPFF